MTGVLVLAATPIGDPRDAAPRLAHELASADIVAAEDTRRLRRLTTDLGVTHQPVGCSATTSTTRRPALPELVDQLLSGARVLVVTDAGMPSVSDPGYRLVSRRGPGRHPGHLRPWTERRAHGAGRQRAARSIGSALRVSSRASRVSGPARSTALADEPRTMVFFEAPHRTAATLAAMATVVGGRPSRGRMPRAHQDLGGGPPRWAG
jgi:16S rRNA (cytidine1402-2'-O)-methyltransferase